MKKILTIILVSWVYICCPLSEGCDKILQFEYYRDTHISEYPDEDIKDDYDKSMRRPALLSMLQIAIMGIFPHDDYVSFTRGIMVNLPVFDEKLYIYETDPYRMLKNLLLMMYCTPQKECSGMCLLDFDDKKKLETQYNPHEISKLIFFKKVSIETELGIYLKLIDEDEHSYDKALEYALFRIVEYVKKKDREDLNSDEQDKLTALQKMVRVVITRMSVRQLYDPFMTIKEKSTAWYLVKDFSVEELKALICIGSLNHGSDGVCIYACPEKWKQKAERSSIQSMAEAWHREIRCLYPSKTNDN